MIRELSKITKKYFYRIKCRFLEACDDGFVKRKPSPMILLVSYPSPNFCFVLIAAKNFGYFGHSPPHSRVVSRPRR